MLWCLDGRSHSASLGPRVDPDEILALRVLAERHGFRVAGLSRFDRRIDPARLSPITTTTTTSLGGKS
jgi:hypothetical protein